MEVELDDGEAAAALTAEQFISSAGELSEDDDAGATVLVTQAWEVGFEVAAGEDESAQAALDGMRVAYRCHVHVPEHDHMF